MSDSYLQTLKHEFGAGEGSFLIQLRPNLIWDKEAFSRLVAALEKCCKEYENKSDFPRWLAEGFFYLPQFVKDWSSHPNFPKVHSSDYYERACQRLDDLAYWFFHGERPYQNGEGFDPL